MKCGVIIWLLLSFLVITGCSKNAQEKNGVILLSETWSGTIHITGDVLALGTITILPGTKILFEKLPDIEQTPWTKYADEYIISHNDPTGREGYGESHFEISGKIIAQGTPEHPIIFTSAQEHPEYADWDLLVLEDDSILDNVEVAYSHNGITIEGDNVLIKNSKIHEALWSCIDFYGNNATIENNEVYHCWHQAIGTKGEGKLVIYNNTIHDALLAINCEGMIPAFFKNHFIAAPISENCGDLLDNFLQERTSDSLGGTYNNMLIYPAQ